MNNRVKFRTVTMIILIIYCIIQIRLFALSNQVAITEGNDYQQYSRHQIVKSLQETASELKRLEATMGFNTIAGIKVYSETESQRLWSKYLTVQEQLQILKSGKLIAPQHELKGYLLDDSNEGVKFEPAQVQSILAKLLPELPKQTLRNYRIFLMPYQASGVSGVGGTGFSIIFALPSFVEPDVKDLEVTLLHEIGHHIHMTYMPETTKKGRLLWEQYHQIRGGSWQGPGKANSEAWNQSSEETFAEDFRMLFGAEQPFYNDIVLGDPRQNPEIAAQLKDFIWGLLQTNQVGSYRSPWIDQAVNVWLLQSQIITMLWLILLVLIVYSNLKEKSIFEGNFFTKALPLKGRKYC
ncbi:MAG TPA: hypothetical protein PLZ08_02145 [Bacillota bacterium]|nr:hypothetical protein [Bacillota bacterium]